MCTSFYFDLLKTKNVYCLHVYNVFACFLSLGIMFDRNGRGPSPWGKLDQGGGNNGSGGDENLLQIFNL